MKKPFLLLIIIFVVPTMAFAGIGAKFGFSKDAKSDIYDKGMTLIGVDYRFTALPAIDIIGTFEYSWKKYKSDDGVPIEGTKHFLTFNASIVKPFEFSLLKPYAGLGFGMHSIGGTISAFGLTGGSGVYGTGFHFIGGIRIAPPAAPISVYGEYRHYWTNFEDGNGRYFTLAAGVMLGF